jgi:hypothetical protein
MRLLDRLQPRQDGAEVDHAAVVLGLIHGPDRLERFDFRRATRRATRDYIVVLEAGLSALTNEVIEGTPEMAYIRSMLAVTTGRSGSGGFGTPIGIEPIAQSCIGRNH